MKHKLMRVMQHLTGMLSTTEIMTDAQKCSTATLRFPIIHFTIGDRQAVEEVMYLGLRERSAIDFIFENSASLIIPCVLLFGFKGDVM